MLDQLAAAWPSILAASGSLPPGWAYPIAAAVLLGLALLLARSVLVVALVALPLLIGLLPGLLPAAAGPPQALALVLGAIALSAGTAARQRRLLTEQVLQRIALQEARIEAFCAALDRRAGLVDARALNLATTRPVPEPAEPAQVS
jgi:hypothetical protein